MDRVNFLALIMKLLTPASSGQMKTPAGSFTLAQAINYV
jgi:hypothetical protein